MSSLRVEAPPPAESGARSALQLADPPQWIWSLAARDAASVASRLEEHDSLHLQVATAARLRERCQLSDPERVFARACIRVAVAAAKLKGDCPPVESMGGWIVHEVDLAAEDVLLADRIALRDGLTYAEDRDHYDFFHLACMVVPESCLFVSVNFHDLPFDARRAFFALFIEQKSVDDALAAGLGPRERLRRNAQISLDAAAGVNPSAAAARNGAGGIVEPWWAQPDTLGDGPEENT